MKKPAAKNGSKSSSMKDQLDKLGQGIAEEKQQMEEGEEEEQKEEDEEVEAEAKRDRLKSGKFGTLLKSGKVPDNIKKVWEACENRKKKTQLLNRRFVKNEKNGQWEMKTQNPEFLSFLRSTDQTYGQAASRTFPKADYVAQLLHAQRAMQQALQDGISMKWLVKVAKKCAPLTQWRKDTGRAQTTQWSFTAAKSSFRRKSMLTWRRPWKLLTGSIWKPSSEECFQWLWFQASCDCRPTETYQMGKH